MRILGLDHGTKRIGLAISDETEVIAQPLDYLDAEPFDAFTSRLKEIIETRQVQEMVVGMPRNMDGTYGPAADKVKEFIARMRQTFGIPIKTWDERLTSVQANRSLIEAGVRREQRRERVDKTAAAILLQSYLDSRSL